MYQERIDPYISKKEVFSSRIGIIKNIKHLHPLFNSYKILGLDSSSTLLLAIKLWEFNRKKEVDNEKVYEIIKRFTKKSQLEINLMNYSITQGAGFGYLEEKGRKIFRDSNYQFILKYNENFSAVLGFEPCKNAILISQIQGVKGNEEILKPIKWSNILVNIVLDFAKDTKIPEVYLLPYRRNDWPKVYKNVNNAKFYYDITAKKEGFKYDTQKEVYVKKIS